MHVNKAKSCLSVCVSVCLSVCFFVTYARPQFWADLDQIWRDDDDDDDDLLGLTARGWITTHTYMHTYSNGKLGLYIKYIHTVKFASDAESNFEKWRHATAVC